MLHAAEARLDARAIRVVAVLIVGVVLLAAGAAGATREPHAVTSTHVVTATHVRLTTQVAPQPVRLAAKPAPAPSRRLATVRARPSRPTPKPPHRSVPATPPIRWLPTGTGMWLHDFLRSEGGDGRAVVARAKEAGLSTLYVQTGSSKKGWIGSQALSRLLPATRGTNIKVVAWDFPTLVDPVADAKRLALAAGYRCHGCPTVAAVAPDVETAAEGTRIGVAQVTLYYRALRQHLPRNMAILATVPWPSEVRVGRYPYQRTASLTDAMMPMAYWYNRSPAGVTATSMSYLRRFHRPLLPVGQGYDGRIDAPYLAADPHPGESVRAFLLQAHRAGARAVSLWSWDTAGSPQWRALSHGRMLFRR